MRERGVGRRVLLPLPASELLCLYCGSLPLGTDIRAAATSHASGTGHPVIYRTPDGYEPAG